eukprot:TRINITY_DN501_c1_g4_i1.p1 TRINITY_DN501_c1_g4~~TRINITY_DN501_c1_g4_i1.p1  ORF type:complete len:587 (+),score=116.63 TRINITY_DN501_c1_g4_i1:62-1822(+)
MAYGTSDSDEGVVLYRERVQWGSGDETFMKIDSSEFRKGILLPVSIVQNDGLEARTNFIEANMWDLSCVNWETNQQRGKHGIFELLRLPYEIAPSQVKTHPPAVAIPATSGPSAGPAFLYDKNSRGVIQYVNSQGSFVTPAPETPAPAVAVPGQPNTLKQVYFRFGGTAMYEPQYSEILTLSLSSTCFEGEMPSHSSFQIHISVEDTYDEDHVEASEGITIAAMGASVIGGDPFEAVQFASILSDNCREDQKLIFPLHPVGEDILESAFIGCMVYNTLLIMGAFAIHALCSLFFTWIKGRHLRTESAMLRFPGGSIKFAIFLFQGMLLSSWVLIWTRGDTKRMALPLGIGGIFFLGIVAPVVLFFRLHGVRRFALYDETRGDQGCLRGTHDWYPKEVPEEKEAIKEAKVYSMGQSLSSKQVSKEFKRWQMLFDDHTSDMVKFLCIKMTVSFLFYMIHSLNSSNIPDDYRDCGHIRIASMLLFVIYMALLVFLKPFRVLAVFVVEMVVTFTKALALAFMAAGFYDGSRDHWAFNASAVVVNIGSIVFAVFSIIRFVSNIMRYRALDKTPEDEEGKDVEAGDAPDDEE